MKNFLSGLIVGILLGFIAGLFILALLNIQIEDKSYGVLEVVYYVVTPIGVLVTLLAVIVALWGNEIKNYLHREKSTSVVPTYFTEVIKDEDDPNPEAARYECNLSVKNTSAKEICECRVSLLEVHYGESSTSKLKRINISNRIPIYWKYPDVDKKTITPKETATITLFKIMPEIALSKSDNSGSTHLPRHLSIVGLKSLPEKYTRKGYWKITYCVTNSHRELERFNIIVNWSGNWKSREKEMQDEASIEMERINK